MGMRVQSVYIVVACLVRALHRKIERECWAGCVQNDLPLSRRLLGSLNSVGCATLPGVERSVERLCQPRGLGLGFCDMK